MHTESLTFSTAGPTTTNSQILERVRANPELAADLIRRAEDFFANREQAPDSAWYKDYFRLTGQHMILGEYGWEPGDSLASYREDDPEWEPLDEINAPEGD